MGVFGSDLSHIRVRGFARSHPAPLRQRNWFAMPSGIVYTLVSPYRIRINAQPVIHVQPRPVHRKSASSGGTKVGLQRKYRMQDAF